MPLTEENRNILNSEIESKEFLKNIISQCGPKTSAVKLFAERIRDDRYLTIDVIKSLRISYPLNRNCHYELRSRAEWLTEKSPIRGTLEDVLDQPEDVKARIHAALGIVEAFPADIDEFSEVLTVFARQGLYFPEDQCACIKAELSLCISIGSAFDSGGSGGCVGTVCPKKA